LLCLVGMVVVALVDVADVEVEVVFEVLLVRRSRTGGSREKRRRRGRTQEMMGRRERLGSELLRPWARAACGRCSLRRRIKTIWLRPQKMVQSRLRSKMCSHEMFRPRPRFRQKAVSAPVRNRRCEIEVCSSKAVLSLYWDGELRSLHRLMISGRQTALVQKPIERQDFSRGVLELGTLMVDWW
jgi:hypothetical protein